MAWNNNAETLLGEELTNILANNDISVYSAEQTENGMSIGLEFYSDLGEDVIVDIDCKDKDDFVKKFGEYAQDFDVNEHAEMWIEGRGTNDVPESIADLLEDAQSIKDFLEQVSDELEGKEHTRESAEVTISLNKEELDKIAAFAELDADTMSVEDLAEALHGIVAEMEAPEQEQTVSEEEVIAWGKETLSDLTNGTNQLVITPSGYDDFISSSTILNAFQEYSGSKPKVIRPENTSFSDYLYDEVQDSLFDNVMYLEENLASQIKTLAEEKGDAFVEALENLDEDLPYELLEQFGYEGASVDMSEFLDHDYKVNLLLATKQELNYDNTSISRMAHGIMDEDGKLTLKDYDDVTAADQLETYSDNALSYLVHQQGYTVEEMMHAVQERIAENDYDTSGFIESVVNELDGTYSDYNEQLTALVSINGNALVEMLDKVAEGKDNIVLGTDTVIGLYDRMNGAGSDFEIQLEEDMVIPTTMVQIVQMESSGRSDIVKDNIGYSVDDTYGFVGTQWQDSYKGITDEAPTLVQENMKETYEKLNNFEPEKDDVIKDDKEDDFGLD